MRILSLSTVFPRPNEPVLGIFVRNRLVELAVLAGVRVIAPIPLVDYSRYSISAPVRARSDGPLEIVYPRWFYPPIYGSSNGEFLARALKGYTRSEFDLIDAHFGFPEGVAAARLSNWSGRPFTVTLRGNEPMHARNPAKRQAMSAALKQAAAVICVSGSLREFAAGLGVDRDKLHVIPNGIDSAVFFPRQRDAARARCGMRPWGRHILSAGSLIERKGHHRIVEVLPQVLKQVPETELWIVGSQGREGNSEQEIRAAIQRHGLASSVHLIPSVPPEELAEYMSAADVFCLASSREGWPNVVNEALACGTPVVATDVGGTAEILAGADCGSVVPDQDLPALSAALARALLCDWDRDAIAQKGAARSWAQAAREVYAVFEGILASG